MLNKTDRIAKLKKMIAELPAGSISRKTINGKVYFYHQWQENGKTQGYSVSEEKAAEIKIQIEPTDVENISQSADINIRKVIIDDKVYILREGKIYSLLGTQVTFEWLQNIVDNQ